MYTKIDLYDGTEFVTERSDQKFWCRENQIRYNNKIASINRKKTNSIVSILKSNRNILEQQLSDKNAVTMSLDKLKDLGFDLNYITQYKNNNKRIEYCVFEFKYILLQRFNFIVVKITKNEIL